MLLLQALFSAGAVYLVAADASPPAARRGWLGMIGWALGANHGSTDVSERDGMPTPVAVIKPTRRRAASRAARPIRTGGADSSNRLIIGFVVVAVGSAPWSSPAGQSIC
jgi:hypothetical protein